MPWKLKGRYVSSCSCTNVCPCSTASAPPDNPDGTTNCWGVAVFDVRDGDADGVDLSGVQIGLYVNYPAVVSDGNWKLGISLDPSVSDEQANAIEQIVSGKLGGPFGDMAGLVSEFTSERNPVSYSDSGATLGGHSFSYEPLRGAERESDDDQQRGLRVRSILRDRRLHRDARGVRALVPSQLR